MKSFKNYKLILIISILLVSFGLPAKAQMTQEEKRNQTIEIIKQEIRVLQSLLKNLSSASNPSYEISAKSYVALDIQENKILLEKNSDQLQSIASVTKLMNAVVAEEKIDKTKSITLDNEMLNAEGNSPSIYNGLTISFENLLRASLIQSVNDAAQSISYFLGKNIFLDSMNQKAKDIGMINTIYVDATGLNPENKSTANDLAKLTSYVYKNHSGLLDISKGNNFWLPDQKGKQLKFKNVNNFYYLPEFLGGKTGYLIEARENIASVFNINGKPTAIITLNSENQQADTLAIIKMLEKQ